MDRRGLVQILTAEAGHLLGITREQGIGKPLASLVRLVQPESGAPLKIPTPHAFARKRTPRTFERCLLHNRLGRKFLVHAVLSPVETDTRRIGGAVLLLQDVSAAAARERIILDRKMIIAIANLAGSMAGDYDRYLERISDYATSLTDSLLPQSPAHEDALKILQAARGARDLTRRLLTLAKVGKTQDPHTVEDVDLAEIIGDAISLTQGGPSRQPQVRFNLRHLDRLQRVRAEPSLLLDCLLHLFQNAKEAMPNGGVITLDILPATANRGRLLALRVSDTGCGIPREHLPRVFDPFFSTKKTTSALGLGLTLTRNIVELWGGHIKIHSRVGKGTTVTLLLPAAAIPPVSPRARKSATGLIVVADDHSETVAQCTAALEAEGYRVMAARTASECAAACRQHGREMVVGILDALMLVVGDRSLFHEIIRLIPSAAIILTSGFPRDYIRSLVPVGGWSFLQKPFDAAQLVGVVRRSLDQRGRIGEANVHAAHKAGAI